jgi:beta-glucosidase
MSDLLGLNGPAAVAYGNGEVITLATLKAAAKRMLVSHMRLGFYDSYKDDYPFKSLQSNESWELLDSPAHRAVAREVAAKSTVLLKNNGSILPLLHPKSIAVVGPFAACSGPKNGEAPAANNTDPRYLTSAEGACYLHSYNGNPSNITSIYGGIAEAGEAVGATVSYSLGSNNTCHNGGGAIGEVDCVHDVGSTFYEPAAAAAIDAAKAAAAAAEVTVLVLGLGSSMEAEGRDRVNVTMPSVQRALYEAVAAASNKLVLVIVSAGGVDIGDETAAQAIVFAPYGGEEAGSGLADVLFGKINPSARLPTTWVTQSWADDMNCPNFTEAPGQQRHYTSPCNTSILRLDLEAGVGRTHRYIQDTVTYVKHAFGFGLSYTTWGYSGLTVHKTHERDGKTDKAGVTTGKAFTADGNPPAISVEFTVKNTGPVSGAEIVQVYVAGAKVPGLVTPLHNLVGFTKVELAAGASQTVHIVVDTFQLETTQADGSRTIIPGTYTLSVGGHQPGDSEGTAGSSGPDISTTLVL